MIDTESEAFLKRSGGVSLSHEGSNTSWNVKVI